MAERHPEVSTEERAEMNALEAECRRLDEIELGYIEKIEKLDSQLAKLRAKQAAMQPEINAAYDRRDALADDLKLAGKLV